MFATKLGCHFRNFQRKIAALEISPNLIDEFVKVIQTCEVALFAGMDNQASMQTTYENAIGIITRVEDEINKHSN